METQEKGALLIGVLLTNGLLIKRGGDFTTVKCPHINAGREERTAAGMWSYYNNPCCGGECVMFGEPIVDEQGVYTLEICNGKVLKFKRLIDLRGSIDLNIDSSTNDEIVKYLMDNNIIR